MFGGGGSILPKDVQRSDELPAPARLPPPSRQVSKSSTQSEKIAKYLTGVGQNINPEAGACMKQAEPAIHAVIKCFLVVAPLYKKMYVKGYEIYQQLPHNVLYMIFGACLCFFGGTYVASIAAIEAFRQLGWQKTYEELQVIYGEVQVVIAASEEDDKVDRDNNGVADVDEMEPTELAQHKLKIAMTAIKAPEKLQTAWGSLFASYLAVLATLRLEFARTTAFALGIVEMAKFPIIRSLSPGLAGVLGADLAHWTQTIIESSLTFIAIVIAWWLQMIISAFYSGLRGGRMFADGLIAYLTEQDMMSQVPFIAQPFDPEESYLDEGIGYTLAAFGFCFQIFNGFSLPFPLNLVFLPLTIIEWFLRIQISMEGSKALI